MTSVKVSRKNQIAVPAAARRRLGIRPGDRLEVEVRGGAILLRPRATGIADELRDLAPELWQGVDAAAYLRELRDEWTQRER